MGIQAQTLLDANEEMALNVVCSLPDSINALNSLEDFRNWQLPNDLHPKHQAPFLGVHQRLLNTLQQEAEDFLPHSSPDLEITTRHYYYPDDLEISCPASPSHETEEKFKHFIEAEPAPQTGPVNFGFFDKDLESLTTKKTSRPEVIEIEIEIDKEDGEKEYSARGWKSTP